MVYKMNESIIVIQAEAIKPNDTNVVFWSHDRGTAKLRMKLVRKNGIPQSLPEGTTVPIRLIFKSATAEDGYGKHDYLATIEDRVNGIVSIVLEDNILGYVGKVEGSVYIDFPDDRSLDTAGRFTFDIKRSPIDDSTPELEDYYFNGFSQTIDKIEKILADGKQEIDQKIAESETQIDAKLKDTNDKITKANQDVATLNTNIDKANDRIDQTNQQIGDLGKLKKMYSNSLDFGDYDYSGNPNLFLNLDFSKLSRTNSSIQTPYAYIKDHGTYFEIDGSDPSAAGISRNVFVPFIARLEKGATYIATVPMMVSEDFSTDFGGTPIYPYSATDSNTTQRPVYMNPNESCRGQWQFIKKAFTVPNDMMDGNFAPFLQVYQKANEVGKLFIGYDIKIEKVASTSSPATAYQPNLLGMPYYLSKVALGENLIKPESQQPVTNSNYLIKTYNTKPMVKGKKYTITLEGTKPTTQVFRPFFTQATGSPWGFGDLKPVEGLTDIWSATFTASTDSHPTSPQVQIYQVPNTSVGQCTIKWLKLEEGDTRTPNISQFKYFGEGLKDSNNPNDYSWDITPEYTEKGLNDSVSLTEPQSVDGTKNFLETPLVNGKNVLVEEKLLPYEAWHSTGTEQTGISNKARLIIGPVATTIGAKLNRSMKENPLTWNSGNWQATANRDCTLLVEGLVRYQFGGSTAGQYGYITFYKDDAQTSSIGFAGGVGINGTALQWKHGLHFSRIFALKKGEYFNITFETQDGKKLDFSQINTLHIMEIES
ncbi:BppU family phage baseplate upper protein [Enterococcus faecium]|uniref:BppU family phage baseplate upper protein n=1 Tax=Enterococcus TaxID=1350 RepID=UPI00178244A3|nr:BppU family phage baseplate upper protein [Enterococcus faecium]EGP4894355.1 BppU family phage baseplate upper protein [Enterococcus faecium]EGP4926835.1 BppU family phage baseplate upper protein [Enterococcus faecium]EHK9936431.1 BppU family phage baseplate upper protein [Enterococcus faecium]EME3483258.1 BppU family phage baseplate upper protein [Enterococcus faecium]EME3581119.1 BppU family phage baseplate upper protein [Enterococcus faecium]